MVSNFTIKKELYRHLEFFCLFILLSSVSFGQLTGGTYSIDGTLGAGGTNFQSFSTAIAALNTGITGPVTFNVSAGQTFPENPPAINIPSGNILSNPIIFQKSGGGANPLISYNGGTASNKDGIIVLKGTRYITFNGIDLTDASPNVNKYSEWGYALLKQNSSLGFAPYNGCQNVTIENCTIQMNKVNPWLSYGIYSGNHSTDSLQSAKDSLTTDAMNNCKFQNNTISNVFAGIYLYGFNYAPVPYTLYDQNNEISGNTINDVGGTVGTGNKCSKGIFTAGQNNITIINNIIDNTASATAYAILDSLIGIYSYATTTTSIGVNITISNNLISLRSTSANKVLAGIINLAGNNGTTNAINITKNTIQNCTALFAFYGIYNTGGGSGIADTVNICEDTVRNCTIGSGPSYGIWSANASYISNVSSNVIQNITLQDGTWEFDAISHSAASNYWFVNYNTVSGISITKTVAFTPTFYGLKLTTPNIKSVCKFNTVHDITISGTSTTTTSAIYGISDNSYAPVDSCYSNTVYNLTLSLQGSIHGLYFAAGNTAAGIRYVSNNIIHDIQNNSTGAATSNVYGINISAGCFIYYMCNNSIYKLNAAGAAGKVYGIMGSASVIRLYCYNNIIANLTAPASTATTFPYSIQALTVNSAGTGGTSYIYNNTIYLNATSSGTNFSTAGLYLYTTPAYECRNNIVVNTSTAKGTGKTVAFWKSSAASNTYSQYSNNNCYYAGTPSASNLLYYDGTNSIQDITIFRNSALISPAEGNSFSEFPSFIDAANSNLHINTLTATLCEKGGAPVTIPLAITKDIEGNTRDESYPDAGAYEFSGTQASDIIAPRISFTPLTNVNTTTGVTLKATFMDPSGVPTSDEGLPMLYWKVMYAGSWTGVQGEALEDGQYTFTFGSGASGDSIYYCFVAQDALSNVLCYPLFGSSSLTTEPPAGTTYSTVPYKFKILGSINGSFTIGPSGANYPTLTAAVIDLNSKVMAGPVTFTLNPDYVSTSETYPIVINNNPGSSAVNVLTIKPGAAGLTISGASTGTYTNAAGTTAQALIIFNGTQYAVLDGSSNGTTSRDLTINNTSTYTTSAQAVIDILGLGSKLGASGINIKNCIIKGGIFSTSASAFGTIGICIGGNTQAVSNLGTDIANISITNNKISLCNIGINMCAQPWGYLQNITINNNTIGDPTLSNSLSTYGIWAYFANNLSIDNNEIMNITNGFDYDCDGIKIYYSCPNLTIKNNYIHDISGTTTSHWQTSTGIYITDGNTSLITNNSQVYNNIIHSVKGTDVGVAMSQGIAGILVNNTANTRIYYNTIVLNGNENSGGTPGTTIIACIGIMGNTPYGVGLDIRDNILINTLTPFSATAKSCGLYVTTGAVPSIINYNDYVVSGGAQFYTGCWGSTNYLTLTAFQSVYGGFNLNSVSEGVDFTPNYRLGTSNGDVLLTGTPVAGITTDIDGNLRNISFPYMGASEGTTPLPVELTTLTASINGHSVNINWVTKTEVNANKFGIERAVSGKSEWYLIGEINAHGNKNTTSEYGFTDKTANSGKYSYRLKMIDNDGGFTYSDAVETEIKIPVAFSLSQNYPNPFNPTTKIDYQIPLDSKIHIEVYNIAGQKVADLINEEQAAGYYTIEVGARSMHKNLASGVYIYKLTAINKQDGANFTNVKKMILLK